MEISEEAITDLAGGESFQKGLDYYQAGLVTKYRELDGVIRAEVSGSKKYHVEVNTWDLSVTCDCPAIFYQKYCKHVVAVLLTKAKGPISTTIKNPGPTKKIKLKTFIKPAKTEEATKSSKEITSQIKNEWHRMKNRFGYQTYWGGQEDFADYLHDQQFDYPSTQAGFEAMMDLAFWLGDHFDADDSNGVLQDAIYELVAESIGRLEANYQGLPTKYLSRHCEIDVAGYLVSAMFAELIDQKIVNDLIGYVSRGLKEDTNLANLLALAQYYIDKKLEAEIDNLFDRYPRSLARMYLNFLFDLKKSGKIIEKLWNFRNEFSIDTEKIIWALKKEHEYRKLLEYYSGIFLRESVSSTSIQKLREYCKLAKEESFFDQTMARKKAAVKNSHDLENILMYERNYREVVRKRIATFKKQTIISRADYDEMEAFGTKMLILDRETGIELFDCLAQDQMEKLARSNHYDKLEKYLSKLVDLGQLDKVKKYAARGIERYPTKKTLIKMLSHFTLLCLDDILCVR